MGNNRFKYIFNCPSYLIKPTGLEFFQLWIQLSHFPKKAKVPCQRFLKQLYILVTAWKLQQSMPSKIDLAYQCNILTNFIEWFSCTSCATIFVLDTFWHHLWSITEQLNKRKTLTLVQGPSHKGWTWPMNLYEHLHCKLKLMFAHDILVHGWQTWVAPCTKTRHSHADKH